MLSIYPPPPKKNKSIKRRGNYHRDLKKKKVFVWVAGDCSVYLNS